MTTLRGLFVSELPNIERGMHQYARFLEELGNRLGHPVSFVQSRLCDIKKPFEYIVLETLDVEQSLAGCDPSEQAGIARRVVPVYPRRNKGTFHAQMETLRLAGALEPSSMASWDPLASTSQRTEGLTGWRDLATIIGATCMDDLMMPPAGYCFM